ncbi:MAG TPA: hypothetical protein VIT90_07080 [Lysobacter sp.]
MRYSIRKSLFSAAFAASALVAATASHAQTTKVPDAFDYASPEQVQAGYYTLERRHDAVLPDYCIEQEALYGYCDIAEEDIDAFYYKKGISLSPQFQPLGP